MPSTFTFIAFSARATQKRHEICATKLDFPRLPILSNNESSSNDKHEALDLRSAFDLIKELLPPDQIAAYSLRLSAATVYNTLTTLVILTLQRLAGGRSLEAIVREVVGQHTYLLPDNKRVREGTLSSNPSGFSKARGRLSVELTENFCDAVATAMIQAGTPAFQDRQIYVIDGTTIALSPTSELSKVYPPATNQFGKTVWPIMMLTVAHELYSGAALRPEFGAKNGEDNTSEAEQIETLAKRIERGSILLADSGYGIFRVIYRCKVHSGQDVIARLTNARFKALKRQAEIVGNEDGIAHYELDWKPTGKDLKNNPELSNDASMRVQIYSHERSDGEFLHVVSTMELEPAKAMELYGLRYTSVEHDIRDLKVTLNLERMAAESEAMVKKEILCSMVAYNLVIQFRRQAAKIAKLTPRRISFKRCYETVTYYLLNFGSRPLEDWLARYEQALTLASKDVLPIRPGRSYARKSHPKRPKSTNEQRHKKSKKTPAPTTDIPPDG